MRDRETETDRRSRREETFFYTYIYCILHEAEDRPNEKKLLIPFPHSLFRQRDIGVGYDKQPSHGIIIPFLLCCVLFAVCGGVRL